jgi:GNAT superfamily N-acetyltransferase
MTVAATATLLQQVFPGAPRIARPDYLHWLYEQSPLGPVIEANLDDDQGRAAHYALVPLPLTLDGTPLSGALSMNTAVHERARGGGVFVRMAKQAFELARERDVAVIVGVANANSTPGFLRRLRFELVTPLPATVLLPMPGGRRGVHSGWAAEAPELASDAGELLAAPAHGIATIWTPERLSWRLAAPGARYALHRSSRALAVSTLARRHGIPVAVLTAVFAASSLDAVGTRALVRAACRFHRAPAALHVGLNDRLALQGIALPRRLRESPLNLIYRDLRGIARSSDVARFELLDFDAY